MKNSIAVYDWPSSMGVTALIRVLPENRLHLERNIVTYSNKIWNDFSTVLFDYFIRHYCRAKKTENYLLRYMSLLKKHSHLKKNKDRIIFQNASEWLLSTVRESLHKVRKNFMEEETKIKRLTKSIIRNLDLKDMVGLEKTIVQIIELLYKKEINEKLTLNYVKAIILKPSVGQVSFLNSSKNYLKLKDQEKLFHTDFIKPIVEENEMKQLLIDKQSEKLVDLLNKSNHWLAKKWRGTKNNKMTVIDWFDNLSPCAILSNEWGSIPYEEKLFMPLASTSLNDRWDGNEMNMIHISSIAKLLLFLSPLGCTMYKKKNSIHENTVFSFLYMEGHCAETLAHNNRFRDSMEEKKQLIIALRNTYESSGYLEEEQKRSTVLVEWFTENKTKKTLLESRVLKPRFFTYVMSCDVISKIFPFEFREAFLQQCLRDRDSKLLIIEEISRQFEERTIKRNTSSLKNTLLLRELLIEGRQNNQSTLTEQIYAYGYEMRKGILAYENNETMESLYQISKEKKIDAFLYRLLTMAKNGNRQLFYNLVHYLSRFSEVKLKKEFIDLLDYRIVSDARFATISLAFIAGLTSVKTNEGDIDNGENN